MNNLISNEISPLDGRYAKRLNKLPAYFSEKALMGARCKVELLYVLALNETALFPSLSADEISNIHSALANFTDEDYNAVKEVEARTNHDVKACEIFLRKKTGIKNENLIHFALTSEDVNNLAYSILLKDYLAQVQLPQIQSLVNRLSELVVAWKHIPFPSRTHGQKASPSTAGKELAVFLNRILNIYEQLSGFLFKGKINGAVGNYSAMLSAFPNFDWIYFSDNFIESLGLIPNIATTQIEDHDCWAAYFNLCRQLNNITIDLNLDCWLYISKDLFFEKLKAGEVGSSTMPHKVNPINFENSEGNLMLSNSLLSFMSDKLCRSRMQRDLSDSTVQRNMGTALAHSFLGILETTKGLNKVQINEARCRAELQDSPELLAEPIQTILKVAGVKDPYNLLKKATRGSSVNQEELKKLVNELNLDQKYLDLIDGLTPENYIGAAEQVADRVLDRKNKILSA